MKKSFVYASFLVLCFSLRGFAAEAADERPRLEIVLPPAPVIVRESTITAESPAKVTTKSKTVERVETRCPFGNCESRSVTVERTQNKVNNRRRLLWWR